MKRKFFSLLVAACAALFSFTGLTGCGGGGDANSEASKGYMTMQDFGRGTKKFHLFTTSPIDLHPNGEYVGPESGSSINKLHDAYVYAKKGTMYAGGSPFPVELVYSINEYEATTTGANLPKKATLSISFERVASLTNTEIMRALGLTGFSAFAGTITIQFEYTQPGYGGLSVLHSEMSRGTSTDDNGNSGQGQYQAQKIFDFTVIPA